MSRVEWEGEVVGEDTQTFKYIDNVFHRLAGVHMDSFLDFYFCMT